MFFKAGRKGGLFVAPGRLDRIGAHEINKIVRQAIMKLYLLDLRLQNAKLQAEDIQPWEISL